jgi:Acetyltransferase (GNAT) family
VLGFACGVMRGLRIGDLTELYVRPKARRAGIARELVRSVVAALSARGAAFVTGGVAPDNAAARSFYEHAPASGRWRSAWSLTSRRSSVASPGRADRPTGRRPERGERTARCRPPRRTPAASRAARRRGRTALRHRTASSASVESPHAREHADHGAGAPHFDGKLRRRRPDEAHGQLHHPPRRSEAPPSAIVPEVRAPRDRSAAVAESLHPAVARTPLVHVGVEAGAARVRRREPDVEAAPAREQIRRLATGIPSPVAPAGREPRRGVGEPRRHTAHDRVLHGPQPWLEP